MRLLNVEMVKESNNVLHHFDPIRLLLFGFARTAMTAGIQGNDLIVFGQSFDDSRSTPIELRVRAKSVDQHYRLSLSFNSVLNGYPFRIEGVMLGVILGGETARDEQGRR